jgi:hypothetical protein
VWGGERREIVDSLVEEGNSRWISGSYGDNRCYKKPWK